MATYIDIGVVRIQRYVGRWPKLRGTRGASRLVSVAADPTSIAALLANNGLAVNDAAARVDGVVSLVSDVTLSDEEARSVAGSALLELRRRLPAAELHGVWADGHDYVEASRALKKRRTEGRVLEALAPLAEFPAARPCGLCHIDPAVELLDRLPEGPTWACADCAARNDAADRRGESVEEMLARALGDDGVLTTAETFEELARWGPDERGNHLATIKIDGNAVGAFFDQAIHAGVCDTAELSTQFTDACRTALLEAARGTVQDGRLRTIPHVVGGDDVLVSVPAAMAWGFVRTYLAVFAQRVPTLEGLRPTTSTGIVIAHAGSPFSENAGLAEELLRKSKSEHGGARGAVLWLDRTRDGGRPVPDRRAWTVEELQSRAATLDSVSSLPTSTRASMEHAIGAGDAVGLARARRLARRLQISPTIEPLLGAGPQVLRDALDISRWWTT